MANIKIAQLTNAITISDTDIVLIEDATQTKKMTVATLKSLLGINNGGVVDSGINANGRYIKFADGTLVMSRSVLHDYAQNGYQYWPYPIEPYYLTGVSFGFAPEKQSGTGTAPEYYDILSDTVGVCGPTQWQTLTRKQTKDLQGYIYLMAIARWKE